MENLYEKLKKWSAEHKKEIWVGACFVLVFWIGFGTGRYDRQVIAAQRKLPNNYSKNPEPNQKPSEMGGREAPKEGKLRVWRRIISKLKPLNQQPQKQLKANPK